MQGMRTRRQGPQSATRSRMFRLLGRNKVSVKSDTDVPELMDTSAGSTSLTLDDFSHRSTQTQSVSRAIPNGAVKSHSWIDSCQQLLFQLLLWVKSTLTQPTKAPASQGNERREDLFWTSDSAKTIYVILALGFILRLPILFYGIYYILCRKVLTVCCSWGGYIAQDQEAQIAVKGLRSFLKRILEEGDKALSGDYSRKVMAAYMIYNCTAPGESYIGSVLRYKMSRLNEQMVEELQEWRERKLGYEKSTRNLFS